MPPKAFRDEEWGRDCVREFASGRTYPLMPALELRGSEDGGKLTWKGGRGGWKGKAVKDEGQCDGGARERWSSPVGEPSLS